MPYSKSFGVRGRNAASIFQEGLIRFLVKRHPAFQDLSRDHFSALLGAQAVTRAIEGHEFAKPFGTATRRLLELWSSELEFHFDEEDNNLVPVLEAHGAAELVAALAEDHVRLRAQFAALGPKSNVAAWGEVAEGLRGHIRWEEDVLFEWMQEHVPEEVLEQLLDQSVGFRTKSRGPSSVQSPKVWET